MRQNRQPPVPFPDERGIGDEVSGREIRLFRKVLVANRGEIACRVMRTCRAMGIATVAVFSDPDASARHVREADEAARLGGATSAASYLDTGKLLAAAARTGADAIHPGYGFLAESAGFAAACREAGIVFVGPEPDVIARMGLKREAKILMGRAGVPVIPGYDGADQSDATLIAAAHDIGFPVMVKASAGGGGKGMRAVSHPAELLDALASARREARAAFGDDTLILEKVIREPRHIEFQIFGDSHGNIVHLGERECTIQRRHQKIIEETPSTALSPELRARMAEAALIVGRTLGYTNAGTVELILDPDGSFYFLEVNTRLQVEHPVTELVTGLDLVRWQILVAEGHPLPLGQDAISFTGHAIEARVYAEDPASGFLPATGAVALWREPHGDGVRVDAGISTGALVSPYYDPMLAKISAYAATREEALRKLERALAHATLFGVRNNLAFLRRVLLHPAHVAGQLSTAFIERHAARLLTSRDSAHASSQERPSSDVLAALVAALARQRATPDPRRWRNNFTRPVIERFSTGEAAGDATTMVEVRLTPASHDRYSALLIYDGGELAVELTVHEQSGIDFAVEVNGHLVRATALETGGQQWWVKVGDDTTHLIWRSPLPEPETRVGSAASLAAPMPGQVLAVLVAEGQTVRAGDPLLILEAMKMEHTIRAPSDGIVAEVRYHPGDQAPAGAILLDLRQPVEVTA